ncbi:trypsin-2-like [Chironomus tepperi]|uniref:trypsin-2-like n=1 Tax=Chironomus tepperi TaxID=113505 RepID=UPI00391FBB10
MKFLIFAIFIATASAAVDIDPYLTSPTQTVLGEFPSAVLIQAPGTPNQPLCGGTIIDRNHVLTSAQCVMNAQNQLINPFWYRITAGDINIIRTTVRREVRRVSRIFVHQNYQPATRNNDLAVLRLSEPFPEFHNSIEPAILNPDIPIPASVCRLVGWGTATNLTTAAIQPEQRTMNAPIIPNANCNVANVHANRVLNTHLCAGSIAVTNPATGACRGNVGSGLYCNERLAGVLSFGLSCGAVNMPGVYIDVRQYRDWINSQLTRTDNPQPGWMPS